MLRLTWLSLLLVLGGMLTPCSAGWPFFSEDGLRKGSPEYYEARAAEPPGSRQRYKFGKIWPVSPRPAGPHQPFIHKYHSAHYWPHPYNCEDRATVAAFTATQTMNGWIAATTLFDYHFDPVSNELNSAGQKQIRWIMNSVPYEHRQVYVALSTESQLNGARTANVERAVATLAGPEQPLPVLTRVATPEGRPAAEVERIFSAAISGMPQPIISASAGDGGADVATN